MPTPSRFVTLITTTTRELPKSRTELPSLKLSAQNLLRKRWPALSRKLITASPRLDLRRLNHRSKEHANVSCFSQPYLKAAVAPKLLQYHYSTKTPGGLSDR